jgi:hypothetical protein
VQQAADQQRMTIRTEASAGAPGECEV